MLESVQHRAARRGMEHCGAAGNDTTQKGYFGEIDSPKVHFSDFFQI
jgi:hypothetical protein